MEKMAHLKQFSCCPKIWNHKSLDDKAFNVIHSEQCGENLSSFWKLGFRLFKSVFDLFLIKFASSTNHFNYRC